jgi:hypothetical protein
MNKKQLMELLSDVSEQTGETYEERAINDSDFDELADVILKQFQPFIELSEWVITNKFSVFDGSDIPFESKALILKHFNWSKNILR